MSKVNECHFRGKKGSQLAVKGVSLGICHALAMRKAKRSGTLMRVIQGLGEHRGLQERGGMKLCVILSGTA